MKARTGRCEGRKPFGTTDTERAIIARMKELRASGMAYDRIAAMFNDEGVPTRTAGKRWHGFAINQILKSAARSNDKGYSRRRSSGKMEG